MIDPQELAGEVRECPNCSGQGEVELGIECLYCEGKGTMTDDERDAKWYGAEPHGGAERR